MAGPGVVENVLKEWIGWRDYNEEIPSKENREKYLGEFIQRSRRQYRRWVRWRRFFLLISSLCIVWSLSYVPHVRDSLDELILFLLYGFIFFVIAMAPTISQLEQEISNAESELDLLNTEAILPIERAQKLFKLHQVELKRYYDQTLQHSSWIMYVGVGCILVGAGVILVTLYLVVGDAGGGSRQDNEKIIIAVLGGVAGILTNFIGAMYIQMFSGTIRSLTEFHHRLVKTHHLHFSNFIAAHIKDDALQQETLSAIAKSLTGDRESTL